MLSDFAVFLAALGITTLEIVEAAAVALVLYGDSRRHAVFLYVALGIAAVLIPAILLGTVISLLPIFLFRLVGAILLLYFGLRLVGSSRRSVVRGRKGGFGTPEKFEKGIFYTAFSVGAIEAFEASIVLVGLLPNSYSSTILGMLVGIVIVVISTFVLRNQVRRIKQANMKVIVSSLLLSFAVFWFAESIFPNLSEFVLIPLFAAFALIIHWIANKSSPVKNRSNSGSDEKLPTKSASKP